MHKHANKIKIEKHMAWLHTDLHAELISSRGLDQKVFLCYFNINTKSLAFFRTAMVKIENSGFQSDTPCYHMKQ